MDPWRICVLLVGSSAVIGQLGTVKHVRAAVIGSFFKIPCSTCVIQTDWMMKSVIDRFKF